MNKRAKILVASVAVAAIAGGGVAVASVSLDDDESPITGDALRRASAAALEHTGGGRVTDTEAGDEDSYYEVEITLDDGSQVDVQLDRAFNVVDSSADDAGEDDDDGDAGAGADD